MSDAPRARVSQRYSIDATSVQNTATEQPNGPLARASQQQRSPSLAEVSGLRGRGVSEYESTRTSCRKASSCSIADRKGSFNVGGRKASFNIRDHLLDHGEPEIDASVPVVRPTQDAPARVALQDTNWESPDMMEILPSPLPPPQDVHGLVIGKIGAGLGPVCHV
jgi:hypothetical protein